MMRKIIIIFFAVIIGSISIFYLIRIIKIIFEPRFYLKCEWAELSSVYRGDRYHGVASPYLYMGKSQDKYFTLIALFNNSVDTCIVLNKIRYDRNERIDGGIDKKHRISVLFPSKSLLFMNIEKGRKPSFWIGGQKNGIRYPFIEIGSEYLAKSFFRRWGVSPKDGCYYTPISVKKILCRIDRFLVEPEDTLQIVLYFVNYIVKEQEYNYWWEHHLFYDKTDTMLFYKVKDSLFKEYAKTPRPILCILGIKNDKLRFHSKHKIGKDREGYFRIEFALKPEKYVDSLVLEYIASESIKSPYDSIIFKHDHNFAKIYVYYRPFIEKIQNIYLNCYDD